MFKIFKMWKVMSAAKKAKIKKRAWIWSFISFGFACFGLGYGLHDPIKEAFAGNPALVWGLTSTLIVVVLGLIVFFVVRRVLRPWREKRQLRLLEQAKLEHELEQIEIKKKEELENDKDIDKSDISK